MSQPPRPAVVLVACGVSFFWAQSSRAVLYSAMPALAAETGLDPAGVGLVTGTLYAGYSVAVYVSGFLPWGRRATVAGGFIATAIVNVVFAGLHTVGAMLIVAFVGGFGVGLYLPRGTAVLIETFQSGSRARAIGWHEVAAGVGLMAAPIFMSAMLPFVSWRTAVIAWSLVGVVAALAVWRGFPDAPAQRRRGRGRLPLDGRAVTLACIGGACFSIIAGFFSMLPMITAVGWGVTPAAAAGFTGWTRIGGLAGSLGGGAVTDRLPHVGGLIGWNVLTLGAAVVIASLDYGLAFGVLVTAITATASAAAVTYYALLGDTYRPEERERVFGPIQATASLIGTSLTPIALGFVLTRLGVRAALVALWAAPLMGLAGLVAYRRIAARRHRHAGA